MGLRFMARTVEVIGARVGIGGRSLATADGPTAIRAAGLSRRIHHMRDLGDIVARPVVRAIGRDPGPAVIAEMQRYSLELRAAVEAILLRALHPWRRSLDRCRDASCGCACCSWRRSLRARIDLDRCAYRLQHHGINALGQPARHDARSDPWT